MPFFAAQKRPAARRGIIEIPVLLAMAIVVIASAVIFGADQINDGQPMQFQQAGIGLSVSPSSCGDAQGDRIVSMWNPYGGTAYYEVWRQKKPAGGSWGNWGQIAQGSPGQGEFSETAGNVFYVDRQVTRGDSYSYQVLAYDGGGTKIANSGTASVDPFPKCQTATPTPAPTAAPTPTPTPAATATPAPDKPNLVVQNPTYSPSNPKEGDLMSFAATVKNTGGASAVSSITQFRIDGAAMGTDVTGTMAAGSEISQNVLNVWTATAGSHTLKVCADETNNVGESNKSDNCNTQSFTITTGATPTPTPAPAPLPTDPPAAPSNLGATVTSCAAVFATVRLTWRDNATNEQGFTVWKYQVGVDAGVVQIADLDQNSTSYTWGAAVLGGHYQFIIGAYNPAGNTWSDWTPEMVTLCATPTPEPTPEPTPAPTPAPVRPFDLKVISSACNANNNAEVTLGWQNTGDRDWYLDVSDDWTAGWWFSDVSGLNQATVPTRFWSTNRENPLILQPNRIYRWRIWPGFGGAEEFRYGPDFNVPACATPTPAPTPTPPPAPTPAPTPTPEPVLPVPENLRIVFKPDCADGPDYGLTLGWTNSADNWYLDISDDWSAGWWYKDVSGVTGTIAPQGFASDNRGTLTLRPDVTYRWRIWPGFGGAEEFRYGPDFNVPACATPTPAPTPTPTPAPTPCDSTQKKDVLHVCFFDQTNNNALLAQYDEVYLPIPVESWTAVDHDWGTNQINNTGKRDDVEAWWFGQVNFKAGDYVFHTGSDDGVALQIGDNWVINNWTDHTYTQNDSGVVTLPDGYQNVFLWWYENQDNARIKLWWDRLVPSIPTPTPTPTPTPIPTPTPVPNAPTAPQISIPQTGCLDGVAYVDFNWQGGEGATNYTLEVSDNQNFTSGVGYRTFFDISINSFHWAQADPADTPGAFALYYSDDSEKRPVENYRYWARVAANNAAGLTYSLVTAVTVAECDRQPPRVEIFIPDKENRENLWGMQHIAAEAKDNVAVAYVQFFVDELEIGRDDSPNDLGPFYETDWDASKFAEGQHTIKAVAYDTSKNNSSVEITVTVTKPQTIKPQGTGTKEDFKRYIRAKVDDEIIDIPKSYYAKTEYIQDSFGKFLYGLAGCESNWNGKSPGPPFYGLYQYSFDTWQGTNWEMAGRPTISRYDYIPPDILDGYKQIDTTIYVIRSGYNGGFGNWPNCSYTGNPYGRSWDQFTEEWWLDCPFIWPTDHGTISQGPKGATSHASLYPSEQAIDIAGAAKLGTDAKSTLIGKVLYVQQQPEPAFGSYIKVQTVCGGKPVTVKWAHLKANSIDESLKAGSVVQPGQVLGKVGATGYVEGGAHLHYAFEGLAMEKPYIPQTPPLTCNNETSCNVKW